MPSPDRTPPTGSPALNNLIEPIHAALEERYGDAVEDDELRALAQQAVDRYRHATVTNFVPILAHRYAMKVAALLGETLEHEDSHP